ncbi:MAG: MBL fold metallo-hydrolase [Rhodospirillaceae bacterium]|nr:MBL fold metallo-hydrolase [Rhodospirillaceae bacterium]|tara:strand:- start:600 stop:1622 length:1023 start_codon:yes stop_codon:yes gene_type:complete
MATHPDYPFSKIAYGESMEVAPGIFWLRMPLPFSLDHVNLWLLEDAGGWTLVDTGYNTKTTIDHWAAFFSDLLGKKPIVRVIVTHFHPDHLSLAGWFADEWKAQIWMTYSEWAHAQLNQKNGPTSDLDARMKFLKANGMSETSLTGYNNTRPDFLNINFPLPPIFTRIIEGEDININGDNWRVITGAGHSPEHCSLWCSDRNLLISGDQILPRITTNISLQCHEPDGDPLGLYLLSLSKFKQLADDALILPSHERPFYGLHDRIDSLIKHHNKRLNAAFEFCTTPSTATEMLPVIFSRELSEDQIGFAVGEALAHANRLLAEGKLYKEHCSDGLVRYSQK